MNGAVGKPASGEREGPVDFVGEHCRAPTMEGHAYLYPRVEVSVDAIVVDGHDRVRVEEARVDVAVRLAFGHGRSELGMLWLAYVVAELGIGQAVAVDQADCGNPVAAVRVDNRWPMPAAAGRFDCEFALEGVQFLLLRNLSLVATTEGAWSSLRRDFAKRRFRVQGCQSCDHGRQPWLLGS